MKKPSQLTLAVLLIISILLLGTGVQGKVPCLIRYGNKNNTCSFLRCEKLCATKHKGYGHCRPGPPPHPRGTLICYCNYPC
ncbi:hypothetical protein CARUB_v10011690mg [Capsella rubella]|uniref:Knottin scorpion toxin-like domain-containing protein n=1 Tax=Capsella rubella TaxID=81985 RepID=R0GNM9_9BRAS|nr:defensin-like protein 153 [Capsella rubella]EOA37507.1 hypothetical protein CARUB_v10011690mg [Capsella rubella]